MKLHIRFPGDPHTGLFSQEYSIECPFGHSDYEKTDLDEFKEQMRQLYQDFSGGDYCYAEYDFEREYSDEFQP